MIRRGVCIVLGGAAGPGKRCVEWCVKHGMDVAFMDIDKDAGLEVKAMLQEEYGVDVFFFHGDVNSEEDRELFDGVVSQMFGCIDYFFNNVPSYYCSGFKMYAS